MLKINRNSEFFQDTSDLGSATALESSHQDLLHNMTEVSPILKIIKHHPRFIISSKTGTPWNRCFIFVIIVFIWKLFFTAYFIPLSFVKGNPRDRKTGFSWYITVSWRDIPWGGLLRKGLDKHVNRFVLFLHCLFWLWWVDFGRKCSVGWRWEGRGGPLGCSGSTCRSKEAALLVSGAW